MFLCNKTRRKYPKVAKDWLFEVSMTILLSCCPYPENGFIFKRWQRLHSVVLLQIEVSSQSLQFQNVTDHTELHVEEETESNLWQLRLAENWDFKIWIFFCLSNPLLSKFLIIFDKFPFNRDQKVRQVGRREGRVDLDRRKDKQRVTRVT